MGSQHTDQRPHAGARIKHIRPEERGAVLPLSMALAHLCLLNPTTAQHIRAALKRSGRFFMLGFDR
ncbi:hypothetical protein Hsc_3185 [Herbaspirillum seropedicae]|nr:hypothetical protein Hsc_3185 [Herbaspirillum seropedicae]